jgi:uncharacterized protein with ACT and thioredoxin-like domain
MKEKAMQDQNSPIVCSQCQEKELNQTRHELQKCKSANAIKDKEIKKKEKTVFILMCIVVGIGAIFGKEAVDSISEWLESFNAVKSQVKDMVSVVPGPGALMVAAMGFVCIRPRRR